MPRRDNPFPQERIYRIDFISLLLCMAVSHIIIGNPFFGAAVYLFADIIKAYYLCNLAKLRKRDGDHFLSDLLLALVFIGGLGTAFLYPLLMDEADANYVSLFVLCLVVRDYFGTVTALPGRPARGWTAYLWILFLHACFDACCAYLVYGKLEEKEFWTVMSVVVLTGILKIVLPEKHIPAGSRHLENKYEKIASYKLFSNMSLYSTIAVNVGIMVLFLDRLMPVEERFDISVYANIVLWLVFVDIILIVSSLLIKKRWNGLALAEFVFGAITWLLGAIFMFRGGSGMSNMLWTCTWGVGLALMSSSVRKFYVDFEAVGAIMGEGYDKTDLEISNTIVATAASTVSSVVMLVLMALWTFVLPMIPDGSVPRVFGIGMMQLPLTFMIVALVFALKQPLDFRNREKLMRFIEDRSGNENVRDDLQKLFVRKYRMRFGVKIACTLVKPFLHLKVSGIERLRKEEHPSVFVCNHGFIYGPISAVIYLPTYFRPWIHNVMLSRDTAKKELAKSLSWILKVFGRKLGGAIIGQLTRATCWALNSFNPIPVVRGASRDVMTTFNESLKALQDGDNILIFPEKPKKLAGLSEDASANHLRVFYTGFAHVGKMYYDKTGKSLLFYPLYSDHVKRTFTIGKPVRYNPALESHESKRVLAEELQARMTELSSS